MKLRFYQKVSAKRDDKVSTATIYVRFTIGHKVDTSCRLPYSINANYWDEKKECIKLRATVDDHLRNEINGKIAELRVYLQREYAQGNIFDYKGWLKTQVQSFFGIMEVTRENKIVDMSKGVPCGEYVYRYKDRYWDRNGDADIDVTLSSIAGMYLRARSLVIHGYR